MLKFISLLHYNSYIVHIVIYYFCYDSATPYAAPCYKKS